MKLHLSLVVVACFAAVSFAQNQNPGGATRPADKADAKSDKLDGTWTVIAIEKDGQPMQDAKDMTVTVKDNTITCSGKDGKQAMTVKFEFTGPGKAKVNMTEGGTTGATGTPDRKDPAAADRKDGGKEGSKEAVYVLTGEYLAVCIHDDTNKTGAVTTEPSSKSKCSIILKRGGAAK
jgi:uncharacterized protein (TIGR03067 family)